MPLKQLTDFKASARYQANLKAAVAESEDAVQKVTLFDKFSFDEQTAELLIVGPLDEKLKKVITDTGAKKLGEGKCAKHGDEILVECGAGLKESAVAKAFKIGKVTLPVRESGGIEAELADLRKAKALADAKQRVDALYEPLLKRCDEVIAGASGEEKTKAEKLKSEVMAKYDGQDFTEMVTWLRDKQEEVEAINQRTARLTAARTQIGVYATALRKQYLEVQRHADPAGQQTLAAAWSEVDKATEAGDNVRAARELANVKAAGQQAAAQILAAQRQRLAAYAAPSELPNPTEAEQAALQAQSAKVDATLEAAATTLKPGAGETALGQMDAVLDKLIASRQARAEAQRRKDAAERTWYDNEYVLSDNVTELMKRKVPELGTAFTAGNWAAVITNATGIQKIILTDLEQRAKADASKQANYDRAQASEDATAAEETKAEQWGNQQFASGIVRDVWAATKGTRGRNPALGKIDGVYPLNSVQDAIKLWRSAAGGDGALVTNLHVPGGRPQAKWEKDSSRPVIEANFCCWWRAAKVNIHVRVEPQSYFAVYKNELDTREIPEDLRAELLGY